MYTDNLESMFKLNKTLMNPVFSEWNKAATEICRRTLQQNLEIVGDHFLRVSDQLQRLSHVKKPEEMIHLQKECLQEDMNATIETIQRMIHNATSNVEEFTHLCSSVTETVTQKEKTRADK